jgi:hypothetical protein
VERYRTLYPALLDDEEVVIDNRNYRAAVDLAYFLQATGDPTRAKTLLDRCLDYIQTIPQLGSSGYGITVVQIYALQGKKDRALATLRSAVDAGWRTSWQIYLKHSPALGVLHDEPEYMAIVAELEADMAAQLDHIRKMEANGELERIPE